MPEWDEIARLSAEAEHWKAHAEEAGRGFSEVCKTYARVSARNSELVRRIEALADQWETDAAEARRDIGWAWLEPDNAVRRLRAAVSTPPAQTAATGGDGRG